MDNPDRTAKPHVLFSGSLSDAPGRDEHWNEHVTYLGREKWQLTIEGSTFDGGAEAAPEQSTMTTEELLQWALEQADENDEGAATRMRTTNGHRFPEGCSG